jgi:LmbE family N-acetylglucosaminyl deacetylase
MHRNLGRTLLVWTHEDDFATNAAIFTKRAKDAGAQVTVLILTDGTGGWHDDRWPKEKLAEIRRLEEITSCELLGITDVRFAGMPDEMNLNTMWAVEEIDQVIHDIDPDTVITFGRKGLTGHPAHDDTYDCVRAVLRSPQHRSKARLLITVAQSQRWLAKVMPLLRDTANAIFADVLEQSVIDNHPDFEIELSVAERELKWRVVMAHESQMVPLRESLEDEGRLQQVSENWFWYEAFHIEQIAA